MTLYYVDYPHHDQLGMTGTSSGNVWVGKQSANVDSNETSVGARFMQRMPLDIPKGATINSATLTVGWSVKSGDQDNSATHVFRAHASGNSPMLVHNATEYTRPLTTASVTRNWVWTANVTTGTQYDNVDVTAILQEVVNRSDWQPGGYVTFAWDCTAETNNVNVRYGNYFDNSPYLYVTYTENPAEKRRWDVNLIKTSTFGSSASSIDYWYTNPLFGGHTDVGGTISWDNSMRRTKNRGSLKYVAPAPQDTRATGVMIDVPVIESNSYVFYGWVYVPSSTTCQVDMEFAYFGGQRQYINGRDRWIPFCTPPVVVNAGSNTRNVLRPMLQFASPFVQGDTAWISDVGMVRSSKRIYPWSIDDTRPDITSYATQLTDLGQIVRESRCRKFVLQNSVATPRPSYRLQADDPQAPAYNSGVLQDGMWDRSETRIM